MNYQEAVTEAASALKRGEDANWELARLTYENTWMSGNYDAQPDRVSMAQWCADIREKAGRRFSETTGSLYKTMWKKHGHLPFRERGAWADLWLELKGGSYPSTEDSSNVSVSNALEQKRDLAAKLLTDPEIADAVIAQPEARRAVYDSLSRREHAATERRERIAEQDPITVNIRQAEAQLTLSRMVRDFTGNVETFRRNLADLLQQAGPLSDRDIAANRHFIEQALREAREALDSVETYLVTGKTDIDAFLDSVLGGERNG